MSKNLNGVQFSLRQNNEEGYNAVEAHDPESKKMVGNMMIMPDSGLISSVLVENTHQRRGIASEMFRLANIAHQAMPGQYASPKHSNYRSPQGDAWAKTVGGHLPENEWENG